MRHVLRPWMRHVLRPWMRHVLRPCAGQYALRCTVDGSRAVCLFQVKDTAYLDTSRSFAVQGSERSVTLWMHKGL